MSQTTRVYAAEDTLMFLLDNGGTARLHGSTMTMPVERRFGDLDGVRRYLQRVRQFPWGHPDLPMPALRVRKGHTKAHWTDDTIALPDGIGEKGWAMREVVVLHEYAHHVVWHVHGLTGHGLQFQQVYLDLLEHAIGAEAAFVVRAGLGNG